MEEDEGKGKRRESVGGAEVNRHRRRAVRGASVSTRSSSGSNKGKKREEVQQRRVLLHHWTGLQDAGPTPARGGR